MGTTPTVRARQLDKYLLLEVCKNGEPESKTNPISCTELAELSFDVIPNGTEIAVIKGVSAFYIGAAIAHYCNKVQTLALISPYVRRSNWATVVKSISPKYEVGDSFKLPINW